MSEKHRDSLLNLTAHRDQTKASTTDASLTKLLQETPDQPETNTKFLIDLDPDINDLINFLSQRGKQLAKQEGAPLSEYSKKKIINKFLRNAFENGKVYELYETDTGVNLKKKYNI